MHLGCGFFSACQQEVTGGPQQNQRAKPGLCGWKAVQMRNFSSDLKDQFFLLAGLSDVE